MVDLSPLSTELIKKGWKLLKDVEPILPGIEGDVEYVPFLHFQDGGFASDDQVQGRAMVLGANLGQRDAEWLVEYQEKLPPRPKGVRYILFPGTIWKHRNEESLLSPYLYWAGEKWDIYVFWLDVGFSVHFSLVRPKQAISG